MHFLVSTVVSVTVHCDFIVGFILYSETFCLMPAYWKWVWYSYRAFLSLHCC